MNPGTGDPRGPGMKGGSGNTFAVSAVPEPVLLGPNALVEREFDEVWPVHHGRYVEADDQIDLVFISNIVTTIRLSYEILTPNGRVLVGNETRIVFAAHVTQTALINLPEGYLLSLLVSPATFVGFNQYLYAEAFLKKTSGTTVDHQVLCMGYCTFVCPLTWPIKSLQRVTDGAGILRSITGTTPPAGSNIAETVPANTRWQLLSLRAQLTTAVAVASRQANLMLTDPVNVYYESPVGPVQAASLVWEYIFAPTGFAPTNSLTDVDAHYDNSQILGPGFQILTDTANIQAADQWTAPQYLVREWADNV